MKVLRKQPDETWEDVIDRRAEEVGYDAEERGEIADDFYATCADDKSEADAAWEVAQYWDLLETIKAAEPGPDLEEAAA